jgi:hypothetical protein
MGRLLLQLHHLATSCSRRMTGRPRSAERPDRPSRNIYTAEWNTATTDEAFRKQPEALPERLFRRRRRTLRRSSPVRSPSADLSDAKFAQFIDWCGAKTFGTKETDGNRATHTMSACGCRAPRSVFTDLDADYISLQDAPFYAYADCLHACE